MKLKKLSAVIFALVMALGLTSCDWAGGQIDDINRALSGVSATVTSYNEDGQAIDTLHGKSIDIRRDDTFDTVNENGEKVDESRVLKISIGKNIMLHVGSTLILAEDGIVAIPDAAQKVKLDNTDSGRPWLNTLFRSYSDLWKNKARTIMIRSQNGSPIAVFAGDSVQTLAAGIPSTTWFRVDGKTLIVYRADYSVPDTALLG